MTTVYCRLNGKLAAYIVETSDYDMAIRTIRGELIASSLDHILPSGRWKCGPVLALIEGGNQ